MEFKFIVGLSKMQKIEASLVSFLMIKPMVSHRIINDHTIEQNNECSLSLTYFHKINEISFHLHFVFIAVKNLQNMKTFDS